MLALNGNTGVLALNGNTWVGTGHSAMVTDRRSGELYDLASESRRAEQPVGDPAHFRARTRLQEMLLDVLAVTQDQTQPREAFW